MKDGGEGAVHKMFPVVGSFLELLIQHQAISIHKQRLRMCLQKLSAFKLLTPSLVTCICFVSKINCLQKL